MENKKIKNSVSYRILIKSRDNYYKLGTIIIRTFKGDILYSISNKYLDIPNSKEKKEIEHISWHIDGQVHIKHRNSIERYSIIQKNEERQKMSEMGYQDLIIDTIKDFTKLPIYKKKVIPLDVVFKTQSYIGSVHFKFSIISGKLIVAQVRGQDVPIRTVNKKEKSCGFGIVQRALGWHSGHADVMLQYSLERVNDVKIRTNRKIFIPFDMKISKLNYQ